MKKTLLFIMAVLLYGCENNKSTGNKEPIALDYSLQKEYMLVKSTAKIELLTVGITANQVRVWTEYDKSLTVTINGGPTLSGDDLSASLGAKNTIYVSATKAGKFTLKLRVMGEKQTLSIPIDVRARQYEFVDLTTPKSYQATFKYPTKFKIVDLADSTDAYTKRKYEISAYTLLKSTILVDQTKIWCDTTSDFMAGYAKDNSYQFEGEFTPWGAGEFEVIYRVIDDEGVIVDCPVKYNIKPTPLNCHVNLGGEMDMTEKGAKIKISLTPPEGTQSGYYVALEGVWEDEIYLLDNQGNKLTGGTKKQIVDFKNHTGETIETECYLQVKQVYSNRNYSCKFVLYSTGGERWEYNYTQSYPTLEPTITFTNNDIVDFADDNVVNIHYVFDKKTSPNGNSKLSLQLKRANAPVKLPNGRFIEIGETIDATEMFLINSSNTHKWSMPVNVYPVNPRGGNVSFSIIITDEFGAKCEKTFSTGTKQDKLIIEATGNFESAFPNAIEGKMSAKFERSGKTDKLKNLKVNFWGSYAPKGYFIVNGVEVKNQNVDVEIKNTGAQFDIKYVPTEAGEHYSELRFFTQDGREARWYLSSKHN